jgi:hypothetical protein
MDHDHLFKELLTTFFMEFVDLFLPDVARYLDRDFTVVPLSQEFHTDITSGERRVVDLLMQVKFRGENAYFLIHVENQAKAEADFPKRMFKYFARLTEKHDLPVYPVVVFSYDAPERAEPSRYRVAFPNKTVLRFDYTVIQLNRIPWRRFLKSDNPVATALMAKMKMRPKDRPKVKAQCLRILLSLKLDPARSTLLYVFIDSYLKLTESETKLYEREIAKFTPLEQEKTMVIRTSWEIKGLEEGLQQGLMQGKEEIVARQIRKRFGAAPVGLDERLDRLTSEELGDLGEALFDFATVDDLEQWLQRHLPSIPS